MPKIIFLPNELPQNIMQYSTAAGKYAKQIILRVERYCRSTQT